MSNFRWNPETFDEAMKLAGRGLHAATVFVTNTVKEVLSVPAPRIAVTDKSGARYYIAGFKLRDKKASASPYYAAGKESAISSYKFPKGGVGPPKRFTIKYRTAPAIKGDPPRKLSGELRRSVTYEMLDPMKTFEGGEVPTKGRVGTNKKYARRLEFGAGGHEFLGRTVRKFQPQIERILAESI